MIDLNDIILSFNTFDKKCASKFSIVGGPDCNRQVGKKDLRSLVYKPTLFVNYFRVTSLF